MQIESAIETDEHALIQAIKTAELAASVHGREFVSDIVVKARDFKLIQSERGLSGYFRSNI